MPDDRHLRVPGGTCFFTINLLQRRSDLLVRHIEALREAVGRTRRARPLVIDAWVVLPEHMHSVKHGDGPRSSFRPPRSGQGS